MTDQSFVDSTIHAIPFLIVLGVIVGVLVVYFGIFGQNAYAIPDGVEQKIVSEQILHCFTAYDPLTNQPLGFDKKLFTQQTLDSCFSVSNGAYRFKLGDTIITTKNWDSVAIADKFYLLDDITVEVQHG